MLGDMITNREKTIGEQWDEDHKEEMAYFTKNPYAPDLNSRSKLPKYINLSFSLMAAYCPHCGNDVQDKRFKRRCRGDTLFTRKFTDTGITRECRCGFRFYFTWRTYVNVMRKKLETVTDPLMLTWLPTWITMVETNFGLNEPEALAKIEALRERSKKTT